MVKKIFLALAIYLFQSYFAFALNDACDDLWFSRNSIMNDAGFCFGTTLGKAIFDNSDCHTKQPKLSSKNKERIKQIQSYERSLSCNVDTNKTTLNVFLLKTRALLKIQPLNDGAESSCIGYLGSERIPLYVDTNTDSAIIGYVLTGDNVGYDHTIYSNTKSGWFFVSSVGNDEKTVPILGWTNTTKLDQCKDFAG